MPNVNLMRTYFAVTTAYLVYSLVDSGFSGVTSVLDGFAVGGFVSLHALMGVMAHELFRK